MIVEQEVFVGKTLSDIFKDIYDNSDAKRNQIGTYIGKLALMITTPEDAAVISPIIKDFLDVQVKSDEHLVRVAQIAQRIFSTVQKSVGDSGVLSEREKEDLLSGLNKDIESIKTAARKIEMVDLDQKIADVEDDLSFMQG